MGIGRNLPAWCIAGLAASIPVPFIMAGQSIILYQTVSVHMQGRIFSIRNAIQFSTIPVGILLGGYLADYV
ncbi:MAG TPA: MFS transporter, partial [Lachnospiraceae bacterium]|nr:MFS transporter [Lachnospiraceae bacterium]